MLPTLREKYGASISRNLKHRLELLDQAPLFHRHLGPVKLLKSIDAGARDSRVKLVLLFDLAAVHGLIGTLDLDGYRGLASLADRDGLVVSLDGGSKERVREKVKPEIETKLTLCRYRSPPWHQRHWS